MRLPETNIKPLSFVNILGKPRKIYSTTFASRLFPVFLFGTAFTIMMVPTLINLYLENEKLDESLSKILVVTIILLVSTIYLVIGNGFRYVALFEKGMVVKKRFKVYEIKYRDIQKIELRSWKEAIDIMLHDGSFISMGESERLIHNFHYPRLFKGVRIVKVKELFKDVEEIVKAQAHNNGYKQ